MGSGQPLLRPPRLLLSLRRGQSTLYCSPRLFGGKNAEHFYGGRLGQQFFGFGEESFSNLTIQMSLPAGFVRVGVEDSECARTDLNCEPNVRALFCLGLRARRFSRIPPQRLPFLVLLLILRDFPACSSWILLHLTQASYAAGCESRREIH
jgi:hypothetical protein